MSEIRNFVELHYAFYWRPDTAAYVTDLLYKNKYLYDNMAKWVIYAIAERICLTK